MPTMSAKNEDIPKGARQMSSDFMSFKALKTAYSIALRKASVKDNIISDCVVLVVNVTNSFPTKQKKSFIKIKLTIIQNSGKSNLISVLITF